MKIVIKKVNELTEEEYKRCKKLSFGSVGSMSCMITAIKKNGRSKFKYDSVILLYRYSTIIGWALIYQYEYEWSYRPYKTAYFYIHKDFRRCGFGTLLLKISKQIVNNERLTIYPHSRPSQKFFEKNNYLTEDYYDYV